MEKSVDVGVDGTLDEALRHPRLSFLRNELPDVGGSGSSTEDMVLIEAESLARAKDLDVARARGPIGLAAPASTSWFPSVYSSMCLGFRLKLEPILGRDPEVKGVMPRLVDVGDGRRTPSLGSSNAGPLNATLELVLL